MEGSSNMAELSIYIYVELFANWNDDKLKENVNTPPSFL